jgi:hypothetical protein
VTQVFRTLALIYPAANAKWGGRVLGRRSQRVMTREERDALHAVLERVPAAVASWSEGNAALEPLDIVEVRRPLTSLSDVGGGRYWAGPRDVRQEIGELEVQGRYDSIYVLWPSDGQVQHCGWGCTIGPSPATGGAGFSSIPSDHWPSLATDPDPEQGYVHEWCRDASVAPFGQPYNVFHDGGARTWRPWYRDWMTGQVARPRSLGGGCFGLTPELWAMRDRARFTWRSIRFRTVPPQMSIVTRRRPVRPCRVIPPGLLHGPDGRTKQSRRRARAHWRGARPAPCRAGR